MPFHLSFLVTSFLAMTAAFGSPLPGEKSETPTPSNKETRPSFPVKTSLNGRYLVDAKGTPFFYHADTGWAINNLTTDEARLYLDNRKAKGFTVIQGFFIEQVDEANHNGDKPFLKNDLTQPNPPYWANMDRILDMAKKRGFLVNMDTGFFISDLSEPFLTPENARIYGRFLAERYSRKFPNLIYRHGGDYAPDGKNLRARLTAIVAGIPEVDKTRLQSYHSVSLQSSRMAWPETSPTSSWVTLNFAYTYYPEYEWGPLHIYSHVRQEYRRLPVMPVYLGESQYESNRDSEEQMPVSRIRRQPYWALLSGACGYAYGQYEMCIFSPGWKAYLDAPAVRQTVYVKKAFTDAERPWWKLVPDFEQTFVTGGYGTFSGETGKSGVKGQPSRGDDYATGAVSPDGDLGMVYLPPARLYADLEATPRTLTLDLSKMRGPVTVRWFDPTDGTYYSPLDQSNQLDKPLPNVRDTKLTAPGSNAAGDRDWLLILEAR